MKTPIHTIDEYRNISGDVWNIFKKYFDNDSDTTTFPDDVAILTKKYSKNPRIYEFTQKLMRVYFDELHELKQLKAGVENG